MVYEVALPNYEKELQLFTQKISETTGTSLAQSGSFCFKEAVDCRK